MRPNTNVSHWLEGNLPKLQIRSARNEVFPVEKICSFLQMSVTAASTECTGIQSKYLNKYVLQERKS